MDTQIHSLISLHNIHSTFQQANHRTSQPSIRETPHVLLATGWSLWIGAWSTVRLLHPTIVDKELHHGQSWVNLLFTNCKNLTWSNYLRIIVAAQGRAQFLLHWELAAAARRLAQSWVTVCARHDPPSLSALRKNKSCYKASFAWNVWSIPNAACLKVWGKWNYTGFPTPSQHSYQAFRCKRLQLWKILRRMALSHTLLCSAACRNFYFEMGHHHTVCELYGCELTLYTCWWCK